jgi:uncharacterized protein YjbJ (UPF0337 family)
VEEAAGKLTGDKHLKNKGRVDHAKGSTKKGADNVAVTLTGHHKK